MINPKTIVSSQSGLTLVEALIGAAIFMMTLVVVIDLFLIFIRGPLNQAAEQQLHQQLTFALDQMAQDVRLNEIDYTAYTLPVTNPETELNLRTGQNSYTFRLGPHPVTGNDETLYIEANGQAEPLTNEKLIVDSLEFYIYPATDPTVIDLNDLGSLANNQPTVVVTLHAHHATDDRVAPIYYQTVLTSRHYER